MQFGYFIQVDFIICSKKVLAKLLIIELVY